MARGGGLGWVRGGEWGLGGVDRRVCVSPGGKWLGGGDGGGGVGILPGRQTPPRITSVPGIKRLAYFHVRG